MSKTLVFETAVCAHDAMVVVLDGDGVNVETTGPRVSLNLDQARELLDALTAHLGQPGPATAPFLENARFEDIRKGDVVRTEWTEDDMKVIHEGVAHSTQYNDWCTKEGGYLECDSAPTLGGTIVILDRPTPQLPTEPGAVILVDMSWGTVAATRTAFDEWRFYDDSGVHRLWDADMIGRHNWKLAKVVEA